MNYDDKIWRNNGDGTFTDWTENAKIPQINHGRGATTGDYDRDGDIDLFVSNYRLDPNFFFRNDATGELQRHRSNERNKELQPRAHLDTPSGRYSVMWTTMVILMVHANLAHPSSIGSLT